MEQEQNNQSSKQEEHPNSYMPPVEPGEKYQPNSDKKGLVKSLILVVIGVLLMFAGVAGTWTYQNNQITKKQEQITQLQNQVKLLQNKASAENANEQLEELADWKSYEDKTQGFSLKYPPTWATLTECEGASIGFHTAPTTESLAICQSDKASLITIASTAGDKVKEITTADPGFQEDFKTESVALNGVKGTRVSFVDNGQGLRNKGTKNVMYVFFTNNRTYVASYAQEQNYPNELETFITMVTKTLKFSAN